jgi:ferredoxin--NADP+ reductase
MSEAGTAAHPLRVAIVGAGPSGFFLAQALLAREGVNVQVDLYERLAAPYGLVRFGVAPDHERIKNVTRSFDAVARKPGFRFFGNVDFGRDVTLEDLKRHYHQICFTTGAQTDRRMGIPGEDLKRSHPATEFVAWYNGHPDYRDYEFDLSVERVAVIGVGNVAVDVARMLCRTPEELATTDVADYALDAMRKSRVKEVYLIGRRGPVQAAFTTPEAKEMGELAGADVRVLPEEMALDPLSQTELDQSDDKQLKRKVEVLREFSTRRPTGKPRLLTLRFLLSPVELKADAGGRVCGMRAVKNRLQGTPGKLKSAPTDVFEELPVELVFRSVGYRGVALQGVPFYEKWGTIPNEKGRVLDGDPGSGAPVPGLYVSGWIKRGPSGVIGTNKPDAVETAASMLEDLAAGTTLQPAEPGADAAERMVRKRQPKVVSFDDWHRLEAIENERGKAAGRPRVKICSTEEMLAALTKK